MSRKCASRLLVSRACRRHAGNDYGAELSYVRQSVIWGQGVQQDLRHPRALPSDVHRGAVGVFGLVPASTSTKRRTGMKRRRLMAPPAGVEPTTYPLGGGRSIH